MMLMSGLGLLAAAIPLPSAQAEAPYLFQDDFDGPAGVGAESRELVDPELAGRRVAAGREPVPRRPAQRFFP